MKKLLIVTLVLMFAFSATLATDKRVQALGGNAYMLPGDDQGIGLFPQRINDMNLIYFQDIHLGSPNYLLVVGQPGKTWGFYGGSTQKDDYFNIYRSLGQNAAVRMGFRFGITSEKQVDDDMESPATTSEEKLGQTSILMDLEYGLDLRDMEVSTIVTFGRTPGYIPSIAESGSYTGEFDAAGTKSDAEAKGSRTSLLLQTKARAPRGFFLFDNSYAVFTMQYQGASTLSESTTGATTTTLEDDGSSSFLMSSTYRMFNNMNLADDKIFLVYGLGGGWYFTRDVDEDNLSKEKDTDMTFGISGPIVNMGIEAKLKYTTLRFGMERQITTFGYTSNTDETAFGTNNDEDVYSKLTLAANGIYSYNAGMGFNYGDLQIDILVNNNFWIMGPQMMFDARNGTIGICADLIYTF